MPVLIEKRNLNGLIIDGTITESHRGSATVTSHPVAGSSPISDHMYSNQKQVTITGSVSDMPLACAPPLSRPRYLSNPTENEYRNIPILKDIISSRTDTDVLNSVGDLNDQELDVLFSDGLNSSISEAIDQIGLSNFGSSESSFDFDFSSLPENSRTAAALCRAYQLMDNKEEITLITGLKVYENMIVTSVDTETNPNRVNKIDLVITLTQIKRVSARSAVVTRIETAGKGTKDRGKVDTNCLKFREVFTDSASTRITNGGSYSENGGFDDFTPLPSSETVDILTRDFTDSSPSRISTPFNEAAYNEICARIYKRYLRNNVSNVTTGSGSGTFAGIILDGVEVVTPEAENKRVVDFVQLLCEDLYKEEANNCNIPRECREYRYIEGAENPLTGEIISNIETDVQSVDANVNTEKESGYYLNRGTIVRPDRNSEFSQGLNREVNTQVRIKCYYESILRRIEGYTFNGVLFRDYIELVRGGRVPVQLPSIAISSLPPN